MSSIITIQNEVHPDDIGFLVSKRFTRGIVINTIQLPPELVMNAGWTEVRVKLISHKQPTEEEILRAEDLTNRIFGVDKIYLEQQQMTLHVDWGIFDTDYYIVFAFKNGTNVKRIYTVQVQYD